MKKNVKIIMAIVVALLLTVGTETYAAKCYECASYAGHNSCTGPKTVVKKNSSTGKHDLYCCCGTNVYKSHNPSFGDWVSYDSSQHSRKCAWCSISEKENHNISSRITKYATCTTEGNRRYECSLCNYTNDETINKTAHLWSEWQITTTEHYKICSGCNEITSKGAHVDNNADGKCDACDYVMYIIPVAKIKSSTTEVKEGANAVFEVEVTAGTLPLAYQWYYKTSSAGAGTSISGATSSTYTVKTTKDMNDREYYCVVSNLGGSCTTNSIKLTVYYTFSISTEPQNQNVKKGETAEFKVAAAGGNPSTYTYQWYVAPSLAGAGSKILNATQSSYKITPTKNIHEEYYYCVISNGQYDVTSNRAKLVADITLPEISIDSFNENIWVNKVTEIKVPFTITDTGEGYTQNNNFLANDINVKVDGAIKNDVNKTLTYKSASGNSYKYELTLTNITGDGKLSFEIPAGSFEDNFHNQNLAKSFSTNVTIDNTEPVFSIETVTGDLNDKYANADDKIIIKIAITEANSINTNEFTASDIILKVGAGTANSDASKKLQYVEKVGDKYIYELTLENLKGDGTLSLNIPSASINDIAGNANINTDLAIKKNGQDVVIDNTKPVINSLLTKLGAYNSARDYPTSIDARHNNWANEDIYVQINVTDNQEIDYYAKSTGNTNSFQKMTSNQEIISISVDNTIYYRVYDKAGNYAEINKVIKLDKITPNKPVISLFEQRLNGADYIFNINKPTDKSIYVIPDVNTLVDAGSVKSGITEDQSYTYYNITRYEDTTKTNQIGGVLKYECKEGVLLNESGYYEIAMTMEDIAGNIVKSDVYQVFINKKAENTIRITNINDIGSGISKVTIKIFKGNDSGIQTTEEAIKPIIVENPYKEIIKNVRLGKGTFFVEVTLEDKVGNSLLLKKQIVNNI